MYKVFTKFKFVILLGLSIVSVLQATITDEEYALMPPVFHLDNYDHCMLLRETALYCMVTIDLSPANSANPSQEWNTIQEISRDVINYKHYKLRHGLCISESCPEIFETDAANLTRLDVISEGVSKCYTRKYKNHGLKTSVRTIDCFKKNSALILNTYEIIVLALILGQVVLVILGTFYEGLAKTKPKSEYQACTQSSRIGKFISCFSLRKNWEYLISTPRSGALQSLEAIRTICTIYIICCHSCTFQVLGGVLNTRHAEAIFHQPVNMLMINVFVCQPFFLMSSWLLAYYFFKMFDNEKLRISHIIKYVVNRYIRLMPSFIAVLLIATGIYRFFQSGPNFNHIVLREVENCKENWWTNMLLINNYKSSDHPCLFHTWYLAADTQLYIAALAILVIIWILKKYTKAILGISFVLAILTPATLTYVNHHEAVIRLYPEGMLNILVTDDVYANIHIPGHTNLIGSVIGLIFGYIYYKTNGKKLLKTKVQIAVWYALVLVPIIMTAALPVVLFADPTVNVPILNTIHAALSRGLFAFSIGLLVLGISQGHGWILRDCLNWSPFQFLGKLCFCTYLVHPILQIYRISQSRTPAYMDVLPMFLRATDDIAPSFVVGTFVCLFVELPFWSLQKAYIPQVKGKKKSDIVQTEENGNPSKGQISTLPEVIRL